MNYELAKALKDAGFPQALRNGGFYHYEKGNEYYLPGLSELIEACGGKQIIIWEEGDIWYATKYDKEYHYVSGNCIDDTFYDAQHGKTPEEAVAKLYLALHAKREPNN